MATRKSKQNQSIATFDYLRKSTKGDEKDSNGRTRERQEKSIAQQRAELDKLGLPRELSDAGYSSFDIADTFTDEGVSGWKLGNKRPGFFSMVEAIKRHRAKEKVIRVDDIDRFSRASIDDTLDVARQLKQAGVKWIVSPTQVFDIGSGNDLVEHMRFAFAASASHEYSRKLGRRVALARRNQAAEGKRPSAPIPYAMVTDGNGGLLPGDETEVATVHWLFDQFASHGKSFRSLANELNDHGTPAPKGKMWYAESVKRLLSQQAYKGSFAYGSRCTGQFYRTGSDGEIVETSDFEANGKPAILKQKTYKAIVDPKLFAKVQKRLESFKTGRRPRHDGYALSRVLTCDHCGKPMYGTTINGGRIVYRCGSKLRQGKCEQYTIREDRILPGILEMLAEEIDQLTAESLVPSPPQQAPRPETDKQIATLQERIAQAEDRILDVSDKRTRQSLDSKITAWRDELDRLESEQIAPPNDDTAASVEALRQWWQGLIHTMIDADSALAKAAFPDIAEQAAEPAPWHGWVEALTGEKPGTTFLADLDKRAVNEALHTLGCDVRLRFKTEQRGQRRRHLLDRGRLRLGQQTGEIVPSVTHGLPCMSYRPKSLAA